MSLFEPAITLLIAREKGFVDHPADPGGATNYGISLRFLQIFGLQYDFNGDGIVDEKEIRDITLLNAKKIYKEQWWDKYNYGRIVNQELANKVLDMSVNLGAGQAHKLLQRAVWSIERDRTLVDDGILGQKTFSAINQYGADLLPSLRGLQDGIYRLIVALNPKQSVFLNGWLARTYAL